MAKRFEQAKAYTAKYADKLLPCRYCGGHNICITSERTMTPPTKNAWAVTCCDCGDCGRVFPSVRDAVERWNSPEFRTNFNGRKKP